MVYHCSLRCVHCCSSLFCPLSALRCARLGEQPAQKCDLQVVKPLVFRNKPSGMSTIARGILLTAIS